MSEEYKGGEQGYEGDGPNVRLDDFVGRIVQDPSQPPDLLLLSGYLGASSEEGHVRLYLDEELSRYVELPEKSIRHTQELSPEQSPLGGSLVWLERGAEVLHGSASEERRKATFLEGQIAQDHIGAAGGSGTGGGGGARQAGGAEAGAGPIPSRLLGCDSRSGPCTPQTEFGNCISRIQICRTLTGIFCTRFGPGCRRTIFEPVCTFAGPACQSVFVRQCESIFCVTRDIGCQASGFVCNPPFDPTIWQQPQGGPQFEGFAAQAGGGGFGPIGGGGFQTGFNCPSVFDNCATQDSFCPSRFSICPTQPVICQTQPPVCPTGFNAPCPSINVRCPTESGPLCVSRQVFCPPDTRDGCQFETAFNCPTFGFECRTRSGPSCLRSRVAFCPDTRVGCQFETAFSCISVNIRCPTRSGPGCLISQAVACDITRAGCDFESRACGFEQPAGGAQAFGGGEAFGAQPPQQPFAGGGGAAAIRTLFGCFPSQFVRCPSALDACPTRFNCPSVTSPCITQDFSCSTRARCPSAVDACPTRFGCFETQVGCFESRVGCFETRAGCFESRVCGVTQGCFPGGGGGFNPGGGGGGFGGGGF